MKFENLDRFELPVAIPDKEPLVVHLLTRIALDDRGQDIMEYGVLAAFISIAAVATVRIIGPLLLPLFALVAAALQ